MSRASRKTGVVFSLSLALCAAGASVAQVANDDALVAATPHFAIHSEFQVNLHDALLEAGRTRWSDMPELFHSGEEASCFAELPRSVRSAWDHAVGFYAETISPPQARGRQFVIRLDLIGDEQEDDDGLELVEIAGNIRAAAARAYEACRWRVQNEENRWWIADLVPLLEAHGEAVARRLAEVYEKPFDGLPIRTDIVETVGWRSADTIYLTPEGGHIWISTRAGEGPVALETIFHEASHLLTSRGDPIPEALAAAAEKLALPLPRDLSHAVQFYMTGDAVRRVLEESAGAVEADEPEYTPMMFDQDIFGEFHKAVRETWTGYLEGEKALEEAAEDLVRAVSEGEGDRE